MTHWPSKTVYTKAKWLVDQTYVSLHPRKVLKLYQCASAVSQYFFGLTLNFLLTRNVVWLWICPLCCRFPSENFIIFRPNVKTRTFFEFWKFYFFRNWSFFGTENEKSLFLSEKSSLGELKVSVSEWHIGERMDITRINYKIWLTITDFDFRILQFTKIGWI